MLIKKTFLNKIYRLFRIIKNYFICLKYPFLKIESDVYPWIHGYDTIWTDDLPIGWQKSFVWDLCKEIKKYNKQHKITNYHITQVKEKYGGLRWYDNSNNDFYKTVIEKYEDLSYNTCVDCGKKAEHESVGWILPYCEKCKDKYPDIKFVKLKVYDVLSTNKQQEIKTH